MVIEPTGRKVGGLLGAQAACRKSTDGLLKNSIFKHRYVNLCTSSIQACIYIYRVYNVYNVSIGDTFVYLSITTRVVFARVM